MQRVKIGIIGCGNICKKYILTAHSFPILEVHAVSDLDMDRAKAVAAEYKVPHAYNELQILSDTNIEIIVNLTVPQAHTEVALAAIAEGKHVYNEKPLAVTLEDAKQILEMAAMKNVRVGCAPGTFLGAGLQTCRKLIDDGVIGTPVAATAFMTTPGHERWHPNPQFFYQSGGGPMMDMGPYYITALANLLGPIKRVAGLSSILIPERTIGSEPKKGRKIQVETPDHVAGTIQFASGPVATVMTSFAIWHAQLPRIEVYGTRGSLGVPDPNSLKGPVLLKLADEKEWREVLLVNSHVEGDVKWGIGVAEMAHAIRAKRPHRATGENALHALEVMHAFLDSSRDEKHYHIKSPYQRPAVMAGDSLE